MDTFDPTEEHAHDKICEHIGKIWHDIPENRLRPGVWKPYYTALAAQIAEVYGIEHLSFIRAELRLMRQLHAQHNPSINE